MTSVGVSCVSSRWQAVVRPRPALPLITQAAGVQAECAITKQRNYPPDEIKIRIKRAKTGALSRYSIAGQPVVWHAPVPMPACYTHAGFWLAASGNLGARDGMMDIVDVVDVMGKEKMVWSTNVLPQREKAGCGTQYRGGLRQVRC